MGNKSIIKWICHRGLSQDYDENSLNSFTLACEAGFTWLETDLYTTQDNHIVLCHDLNLSKLSYSPQNITQMNRLDLENIQLRKGGKLLFLDEFMLKFNQQNWVFDIKPASAMSTINILKTILIKDRTLLDKIIFLFWSEETQKLFLNDFPEAICFPRKSECYRAGITTLLGLAVLGKIKANRIYSVPPKLFGLPLLTPRIVKIFHHYNAQVIGYLPETASETQQCIDAGVDYILSNNYPVNT